MVSTLQRRLTLALLCSLTLASVTPAAAQFGHRRGRPGPSPSTPSTPATPAETPPAPGSAGPGDGRYGFTFFDARDAVERGEARPALAFYESAAADAEQRGARAEAGSAYACAAFVAVRLHQLQKAITSAQKALDLLRNEPTVANEQMSMMVSIYSALGNAYRNAGDRAQARKWYEQGLTYARAAVAPHRRGAAMWVAGMLRQLAQIDFQEHAYTDARDRVREAVTLAEHFLATATGRAAPTAIDNGRRQAAQGLTLLAKAELGLDDKDAADAALKRAAQYSRLVGLVEVDLEIRTTAGQLALARNDPSAALAEIQRALPEAERIGRTGNLVQLYQLQARSFAGLRRPADALTSIRRSMDLVEEIRGTLQESSLRSGYIEDKQGIYQFAVRMALRTQNAADAFAFAERARARAFLDLLGNSTTLSKGRTRALVQEEVQLRARLAEAQALASDSESETGEARQAKEAVEAADRDYRAFLERVRKENVEQASLMTVEPVTLTEIQGLLPEGTTLVEYLVGNADVVIWIIDRHRAKALTVRGARADLVASVRTLRAAIADQAPLAEIERQAAKLYDGLLAPARVEIQGTRLLIVPHDVLHYLPFAALRSPAGRWLIEDYALATLPSASVLKFLAAKDASNGRPLALGNPDVGPALNLRYAEREARVVGETYPGATVLVRDAASEARVKALAGGAGMLHFATHAELNESEPMSSALLLTPGDGEDGRLEVRELFGLDLHARLVVLSACETGLGKLSRGDDLVGLQRAFLYAGTPAVVTTLWKVDDRASFVLMREFYARLKTTAPGEALSLAQRETLRQFPHPFAWAGYGLTGAPW